MDQRREKGMLIAATAHIARKQDCWIVPSQTMNGRYTVTRDESGDHCTCLDHELRQVRCKHLWAVEFVSMRETAPDGTVTETQAVRVTYSQNWSAYNAAQTTEKEHFCRLLHDLCASVPAPTQSRGRPRLPLSDLLFAAAFKVYSTVSARRFMTDLRHASAQGLIGKTPHYNSIFNAIESESLTPILHDLITASSLPLREVEQDFAVDSTGFGTSQFFRYYSMKYHHEQVGHAWVKAHAMIGVKTNVVTAIHIGDRNAHDYPQFAGLVEATARNFTVREVSADKAYSGVSNLAAVEAVGAAPFIAFRSNASATRRSPIWDRLYHFFAMNRDEFLGHYHKRSNVESTFSAIKRVFGDAVRSRTAVAQVNEVLLKVLCHNIRCLVHEIHELGISPTFERMICPGNLVVAQEVAPN